MTQAQQEFNDKLKAARTANTTTLSTNRLRSDIAIDDALRRESIDIVSEFLVAVSETAKVDEDLTNKRIKAARKSEYGRVPELITTIAKVYSWPVDSVDEVHLIEERQQIILELIGCGITHDLLVDIKEAKGYHSFLDKEKYELVDGVEPEYDELLFYLQTFAEALNLPFIDYKLNEDKWDKLEAKRIKLVKDEIKSAEAELARHEEMMAS